MPIRFSHNGPAFPEKLIDAMLAGEVVFLCGAGISAPQLDDFKDLVDQCFVQLKVDKTPAEVTALKSWRYEEVLGSLSRRILNPRKLIDVVATRLKWQTEYDLSNHETILRLSRDAQNQPTIVTTNFDVLLEQALHKLQPTDSIGPISRAGQDLPLPGSADFGGIIHLHGRIADESLTLEETPLVITSADYGDAYMRSAWASRFLFDLCRCKTVVLIGYSAGDAPVRYFLNVLEADRQRFPDLPTVYAFDAAETPTAPDTRWGTLAVEPIFYRKPRGKGGHAPLWRDLKKLAELVERPSATRQAWAKEFVKKPFANTASNDKDRVAWLFKGSDDLWAIAITTIEDAAWFDFFDARHVWDTGAASWVKAAWVAQDLQSRPRLKRTIAWLNELGKPFADALAARLNHPTHQLPPHWLHAWRLITSNAPEIGVDWVTRAWGLASKLDSLVLLSSDLRQAIELLTPVIQFSTYDTGTELHPASPTLPARLSDILQPQLELRDAGGAKTLFLKLRQVGQPNTIIDMATAKLQEALRLSMDIEGIEGDYDSNNFSVPSVEPHAQNECHDGPVFLVQLLADLYPQLAESNPAKARAIAEIWKTMPGLLGVRLWLHAMRYAHSFSADEAMESVEMLSRRQFWTIRRELLLLLCERAPHANAALVARIEQRILTEGDAFYATYPLEPEQVDWRADARDSAVWPLLKMLNAGNKLTPAGTDELQAIETRHSDLNRVVEERDYFDSYSTGVRRIKGDASSIELASDDERPAIARESLHSPDIEKRFGWSVYCSTNLQGAFNTLKTQPLNEANALLWKGLLEASLVAAVTTESTFIEGIFKTLAPAEDAFLNVVSPNLSQLYCHTPLECRRTQSGWWSRLFHAAVKSDKAAANYERDLYSDARDSSAGRLTLSLLQEIEDQLKRKPAIDLALMNSLEAAAVAIGRQGIFACATLVHESNFLVRINATQVLEHLETAMTGTTSVAAALRSVLVSGYLSPDVTRRFHKHILQGVTEVLRGKRVASSAAASILEPALSIIRQDTDSGKWGITLSDTAHALKIGTSALRESFVELLSRWIKDIPPDCTTAWHEAVAPLLKQVWPAERTLHDAALARQFANLVLQTSAAFPDALDQLKDYLTALPAFNRLSSLENSDLPEKFPDQMANFLWRLFGTKESSDLYGLHKVLNRLIQAKAELIVDRRIQNLYQRAPVYE